MIVPCATCGKPANIRPGRLRSGRNYCSRACHAASGAARPGRRLGTLKRCEVCGAEFYTPKARPDAAYCGMRCKGIASRLPTKRCAVCGKVFKPRMGRADQPCCSRECGARFRRTGKSVRCKACGSPFYVRAGQIGSAGFCSKGCHTRWQGRNKTVHTCKSCGKEFRWSPSRSKAYPIRYCSLPCRNTDPDYRARLIALNARQQRGRTTRLEVAGYAMLDEIGVPYERQHTIAGKFCVDAFVPSVGLVVQFDGDYWHGNPTRFPVPDTRQRKRMHLDKSQDAYLSKCGYRVVRVWESDVQADPMGVKSRLRRLASPIAQRPVARASDHPEV
jgi:very-short-patch-repair endonuclease